MSTMNSIVAVYRTHGQAEAAIKELQEAGVDMKSLSIAAKDIRTDEHVVGYYDASDRMNFDTAANSSLLIAACLNRVKRYQSEIHND